MCKYCCEMQGRWDSAVVEFFNEEEGAAEVIVSFRKVLEEKRDFIASQVKGAREAGMYLHCALHAELAWAQDTSPRPDNRKRHCTISPTYPTPNSQGFKNTCIFASTPRTL